MNNPEKLATQNKDKHEVYLQENKVGKDTTTFNSTGWGS